MHSARTHAAPVPEDDPSALQSQIEDIYDIYAESESPNSNSYPSPPVIPGFNVPYINPFEFVPRSPSPNPASPGPEDYRFEQPYAYPSLDPFQPSPSPSPSAAQQQFNHTHNLSPNRSRSQNSPTSDSFYVVSPTESGSYSNIVSALEQSNRSKFAAAEQMRRSRTHNTRPTIPKRRPPFPQRKSVPADPAGYTRQHSISSSTSERSDSLPQISESTSNYKSKSAKRPLVSQTLSSEQYEKCKAIWSLHYIYQWLTIIWDYEADVPEEEFIPIITGLITHTIPTMSNQNALKYSIYIKDRLINDEALVILDYLSPLSSPSQNPQNYKHLITLRPNLQISGVLTMLTGKGCYSSKLHDLNYENGEILFGRCYSSRCSRTLIKVSDSPNSPSQNQIGPIVNITRTSSTSTNASITSTSTSKKQIEDDWASFWNITKNEIKELGLDTVKKQSHIYDVIKGEKRLLRNNNLFIEVYGESLRNHIPPLMTNVKNYCQCAFDNIKPILKLHEEFLLNPLIKRQQEQGKIMTGVADIFLNWLKFAEGPYMTYTLDLSKVIDKIKVEKSKQSSKFVNWLHEQDNDPRVKDAGLDHNRLFSTGIIGHVLQYKIILKAIKDKTDSDDPQFNYLQKAIDQCILLSSKINSQFANGEKKQKYIDMLSRIQLGEFNNSNLNVSAPDRCIIYHGTALRRAILGTAASCYLILFDNFLLICELVKTSSDVCYKVVEQPIPMALLVVELPSGDELTKDIAPSAETKDEKKSVGRRRSSFASSNNTGGSSSLNGVNGVTDKWYAFKIRHLGINGQSYTIYTRVLNDRTFWINMILKAKRAFNYDKLKRNFEPFKLNVLADYAFALEPHNVPPKVPLYIEANAVDIAIRPIDQNYVNESKLKKFPSPQVVSTINCAAIFQLNGTSYCIMGLQTGIYISIMEDTRGWRKIIDLKFVTDIEVLIQFNLLIVLADKSLLYFQLNDLVSCFQKNKSLPLNLFKKISKHDVYLYKIGQMSDGLKLIYMKKESVMTGARFKVMEPIIDKHGHKKSSEIFKNSRKFYVQCECYGLSIFNSTIAVHGSKGIEFMSITNLQPHSLPELANSEYSSPSDRKNIQTRQGFSFEQVKRKLSSSPTSSISVKPLGVFKISGKNQSEYLLCYDEFAIFCNPYGLISKPLTINYQCKAISVTYEKGFLIVAGTDMLEIRKITNANFGTIKKIDKIDVNQQLLILDSTIGSVKQIITGKNIKLLNTKENQIIVSFCHPREPDRQIVVQLIANNSYIDDSSDGLGVN